MALLVDDLLERASTLLNDETRTRWTSSELVGWINDGQYAICAIDPTAYTAEVTVTLVAGARQTLPAGATFLASVESNVGDGSVVTRCDRAALDGVMPDWRSATRANVSVRHYMYDPAAHKTEFLVYPPQPSATTSTLKAVVAQNPPAATAASSLPLAEKYREPLLNYLLYRALSKDAEEGSAAKAGAFFQAFDDSMKKVSGNAAK